MELRNVRDKLLPLKTLSLVQTIYSEHRHENWFFNGTEERGGKKGGQKTRREEETAKNEETFDPNYPPTIARPLFSLNRCQTQRYRVRVYICTTRFGSVRRGNPVNYARKRIQLR